MGLTKDGIMGAKPDPGAAGQPFGDDKAVRGHNAS